MTAPAAQGSHFWFMSITGRNALGIRQEHRAGYLDPPTGATRLDMFNDISGRVAAATSIGNFTVIAFDIQPNKL